MRVEKIRDRGDLTWIGARPRKIIVSLVGAGLLHVEYLLLVDNSGDFRQIVRGEHISEVCSFVNGRSVDLVND